MRIFLSSVVKFFGRKQIQFALHPTSLTREREWKRERERGEALFKTLWHFRLNERVRWQRERMSETGTRHCGAGAAAGLRCQSLANRKEAFQMPNDKCIFNGALVRADPERERERETPRASEFNKQLPWRHGCCC